MARQKRRKKQRHEHSPEQAQQEDEEEAMATSIEYDTETDSELEELPPPRHPKKGCRVCWGGRWRWNPCRSTRRDREDCENRQAHCWECLRDFAIVAGLLYWVLDIEARKNKLLWYQYT